MKEKMLGMFEEVMEEAGEIAKFGKNFFITKAAAEEACESRGIDSSNIEAGTDKKTKREGFIIKESALDEAEVCKSCGCSKAKTAMDFMGKGAKKKKCACKDEIKEEKEDDDGDEGKLPKGKAGIRDITLTATAKIDGKSHERKKKLKDVAADDIDKEKDKFEKEVNKEFDYDADVTVKVKIGAYEASDSAENHMKAEDDDTDFKVSK